VSTTVSELAPESGLRPYAYSEEVIIETDEELERRLEIAALEYLASLPSYDGARTTVEQVVADEEVEDEPTDSRKKLAKQALKDSEIVSRPAKKSKTKKDTENNSRFKNALKSTWENIPRSGQAITALGALAIAMTASVLAPAMHAKEAIERGDLVYAGVTYAIEQHKNVHTTAIMVGGNYQNTPPPELVDKGLSQGVNVEGLDWVAQMGPIAGTVDSKVSLDDGASALEKRIIELHNLGQDPTVVAYSWGTVATAEAYHRIKQSNPELYNTLKPPVLYGAPLGPNGAFSGPFGPIAMKVLGVDPAVITDLPRGTTFVYSDRDPYATSGPGQQPLTAGFNILMMGLGSHGIQNEDDAYITVEDDNGNFHKIIRFDAAKALGITGGGHDELNMAIAKMFPVNNDPDSKDRPKADAIAAIFYGAQALDRMVDPSGNFTLVEDIQAQLPQEWKNLLNNGINGMNDATVAVMTAANDPTPENIQAAFNAVMKTIGQVTGDMNSAMGRDMTADIKNGGVNVAAQQISKYTGIDYDVARQQLSSFADSLAQSAQTSSQLAAAASVSNGSQSVNTTVNTQNPSITITAPTLPAMPNLNQIIPSGITDIPNATINANIPAFVPTPPAPEAAPIQISIPSIAPAPAPVTPAAPEYTPTPVIPVYEAPVIPVHEAPEVIAPAPPVVEAPAPAPAPVVVDIPLAPAPVALPMPEIVAPAPPAAPAPAPALSFDFLPAPAPAAAPSQPSSIPSFGDFLNGFKPAA
jgi:hypothetical protein